MKLRKNNFLTSIYKKKNYLFSILIFYSIYCALKIGLSWDEQFHIRQGKLIFNYLLSFGYKNVDFLYRENYSSIYWVFNYFITTIFPKNFQIEISHLINLVFSLSTIIGVSKISKELFNDKIAKLTLVILFFFPVFFGHMGFNNKDTIVAFSHTWIIYLTIRYLKNQKFEDKCKKYIFLLGIVAAIGTGIQLVFFGSLVPLIIFILYEIFYFKKIVNKNFSKKKLLYDALKCFIIFYILLIIFWVDTHQNIFILPFEYLAGTLKDSYWTGWSYNLLNGNFLLSNEVSFLYIAESLLYKSPEYFIFLYIVFIYTFLFFNDSYRKEFKNFNYKIFFIIINIIYPTISLVVIPYPVYDGIRLFLWTLPLLSIIPSLSLFFLFINNKLIFFKFINLIVSILFIGFLINFIKITPYHYTYLNYFAGNKTNLNSKFENDYWGASIKELISKFDFNNEKILISSCGVNEGIAKKYFKQRGFSKAQFVTLDEADYVIMTNRTVYINKEVENIDNITTCFEKYKGQDLVTVSRNKVLLSTIRKIK